MLAVVEIASLAAHPALRLVEGLVAPELVSLRVLLPLQRMPLRQPAPVRGSQVLKLRRNLWWVWHSSEASCYHFEKDFLLDAPDISLLIRRLATCTKE